MNNFFESVKTIKAKFEQTVIKKYRTEIIILLSCFLLYFITGIILSYYLDTAKYCGVLFDLDTPRVLGDLSIKDFNHYRVAVHPLFVIVFQPIVHILNAVVHNPIILIILIQSIISAVSLLVLYILLGKMNIGRQAKLFLIILFGISFSQIIFSSAIETYIYAQFLLIPLWLFVAYKLDKRFSYWDYIILVLLGIGSIAVTITNFAQFLIAIIFLIILNKKIEKKYFTALIIVICTIATSVFLAEVQNVIWPSAPNFFSKGLNDLISGISEETLYISKTLNLTNFLNVLNANFAYSFNMAGLFIPENSYLTFQNTTFSNLFSILIGLSFAIMNIYFIIKTKFNISKHKLYYALLTAYLFNFCLHLFYGNPTAFIYICHYNFIIILILAYIINYFKLNLFKYKSISYCFLLIIAMLSLKNIIKMFKFLKPLYNSIDHVSILPMIIIGFIMFLLIMFIIKNKYVKLVAIIIICVLLYMIWNYLNYKPIYCDNDFKYSYQHCESIDMYKRQLRDVKNDFYISYYSDRATPVGIYYFGMANRPKILYKDGKLIDIKTKKIIKNIEYNNELIVPNEYTVLLKGKNGDNYKIFENENGIYFSQNNKIETIFESTQKINLPEFEKSKYSEVLKVVHQEILFNIDGDVPKPNLITYKGAWYRDTMLATIVLEKTSNTSLLKNWVSKINSIYDFQRDINLKEVDNLGELLYIIGAVGVNRNDLIQKVKAEINNIRQSDGSIKGIVDGKERSFYPTTLALYGAKKVGINLNLTIPQIDDDYAKLTWYYDNSKYFTTRMDVRPYPYLDWAFYHYDGSGKLYMLDEIYPLSYEGGSEVGGTGRIEEECFISEYYCGQKLALSHLWHASEMFLFLINY